jgi:hypothetical protein
MLHVTISHYRNFHWSNLLPAFINKLSHANSEEDSDEREPERIGPASTGEIDEYQRAYHKIKRGG